MVKKLLKYEFKARGPILLLMWGIILLIACMVKILSLVVYNAPVTDETETSAVMTIATIFYSSSAALLRVGCAALMVVTAVLNIVRFYKNLYSPEGYLSFTLPVSENQHIFVKTFVSFVMTLGSFLVIILGELISLDVESLRLLRLIFEDSGLDKVFSEFVATCGTANCVFYVIEAILAVIASVLCGIMKYNACLSIGQLARRRKVLLSFGVFAGLFVLRQLIATIILAIIMPLMLFNDNIFEQIFAWFAGHLAVGMHMLICSYIAIFVIGFVLFYLATYLPMKKKLNLE